MLCRRVVFCCGLLLAAGAGCTPLPEGETEEGPASVEMDQDPLFFDRWRRREPSPTVLVRAAVEGNDTGGDLSVHLTFRTTAKWAGCRMPDVLQGSRNWGPIPWFSKAQHELTEELTEAEYPLDATALPFFPRRMMGFCGWQPYNFSLYYEPGDLRHPPEVRGRPAPPQVEMLYVDLLEPDAEIGPEMVFLPEDGLVVVAECGRHYFPASQWGYLTPEGEEANIDCRFYDREGQLIAETPKPLFTESPDSPDGWLMELPSSDLPPAPWFVWPRGESMPPIEIVIIDNTEL